VSAQKVVKDQVRFLCAYIVKILRVNDATFIDLRKMAEQICEKFHLEASI